jgi:GST-like protein
MSRRRIGHRERPRRRERAADPGTNFRAADTAEGQKGVGFRSNRKGPAMTDPASYTPPKVWKWDSESGGRFAKINRPIAGATHEKELPVGEHPLQLYSLATPNGVKVTVLLEELLALGRSAEYDAYLVNIGEGDQFGSGFVAANPNSKIPALVDHGTTPPTRVFESGAILVYLAEKFDAFLPKEPSARAECMSWLFWQMGSAAFLGGGFGHFYAYAPEKYEYPINRYTMEVKRQLDVLDQNLAERRFLGGDEYTIADMATFPWYGVLVQGGLYDAEVFLDAKSYANVVRWANDIQERPAVRRGQRVNRVWGPEEERVPERHSASDLD